MPTADVVARLSMLRFLEFDRDLLGVGNFMGNDTVIVFILMQCSNLVWEGGVKKREIEIL